MAQSVLLPDGSSVTIRAGETPRSAYARAQQMYPEAFAEKNPEEGPKSGFMPALKAGFSGLKGDVAALAGRTGLMGLPEAEKYIAEQEAYQKKTFAPTKEGFLESPLANIKELAGGSIPYMVAPLAAGAATLALPATGLAGAALGLGAAGAASAAQFTGSGLTRQMAPGEGMANKSLGETDLGAAALAAIPMAVLDTVSMRMIPGLGKMFERAGVNLSAKAANDLAKEGIKKTAADYLLSTGKTMGIEGLTEASQQVFERMQAGLAIDNPAARAEYFDNFLGGAVLGGILAPAGRYVERGQEQTRFDTGARAKQVEARTAASQAAEQAAAQSEAQATAQKQDPQYALQAQRDYLAAEQTQAGLLAQLKKGTKEAPLLEADKQENAAIQQQLKEHSATLKKTAAEFNATKRFLPPIEQAPTGETTSETTGATAPTAQPADIPVADTVAQLEAQIEAVSTQAQGASPAQIIEFGAKQKALKNQLAKIKSVTGAMNKANELGNQVLAAKHAKTLAKLQAQVGMPAAVAPAITEATTEAATEETAQAGTTVAPKARKPKAPTPLKPYTGIAEQGLMFPETGAAESVVNVGQGKQPEKSRQELITEFQAAKQVRDRLGMQNAIEQMRTLAERSDARSEAARGNGVPQGTLSTALPAMMGQRLTATGSQPASRELTNAAKIEVTPQTLRRQIGSLPQNLSPESEQLVGRMLANFDEFTADPERAQLAAGFLQDVRTGVQTARSRDVAEELARIEAAKQPEQASVFDEELPVVEGPRKPLPVVGYSEEALPSKPKEAQKGPTEVEKASAELETQRQTLDKEKETRLQTATEEADKRERAALQAYNDAAVRHNALKAEQDAKIAPIYADYVNAVRKPVPNKMQAAKQKLDTALAYRTAKENNAAALVSTKAAMDTTQAALTKVRSDNAKALTAVVRKIDVSQKDVRLALSRKGLEVEAQRNKTKVVEPVRTKAPKTETSLNDRETADAAKRKAENERAERLSTIPGESISFEAHRQALETLDDVSPRLEELAVKAADEALPKTTRDRAKREIKKLSLARKFLESSGEGNGELRLKAEEELAKLQEKIKTQATAVAENATKSRKQELAKSKRREKTLIAQAKSFTSRAERTPIVTPTEKTRQAAENRATRFMQLQEALNIEGTTGALPAREVGPTVRKAQAAGNIRTGEGGKEGTETRRISPGLKPEQGGAIKQPTPAEMRQIIKEASELANARLAANAPLTAEQIRDLDVAHQGSLLEAAFNMRSGLERNKRELQEKMDFAAKAVNPSQRNIDLRAERDLTMQGIDRDLSVAKENEKKLAKLFSGETPAEETQKTVKKAKKTRAQKAVEQVEDFSSARGVEVESPDLTDTQRQHIANDDIRAALRELSSDENSGPINRAVARKLSLLLDKTHVEAIDNLKAEDGTPILGQAISRKVELDAKNGMSQEVLLHEGTHAAVDRVLEMPEDSLTPMQLAAKRELKALFEAAKRDPSITSMNAKSELKEFAAEVLSNRNLQEQLRNKKWTVSDAFRGFVSSILRLLGFTKAETETMLGAGIKSVEALMVPSSKRGLTSERALNAISAKGAGVPRSNSVKDIAALHNGSNSMKQFADQFGPDIKAKDRTPEDAERIGREHLDEISRAVDKAESNRIRRTDPEAAEKLENRAKEMREYIALPTVDSLDYRVRMPDGKPYDENNPLHYIESTVADHLNMKAQTDPKLRLTEAGELSQKRLRDYSNLLFELRMSDDFTTVERALIAKAAGKFSVISDDSGRLKLVDIGADNRHNIAVVSAADAAFIVQKLREGLPLKKAFLEGLQDNADRNVKQNAATHKTGWQKFAQSDTEKAAQELSAGAAGTPWCTAREAHSRGQIARGDFYIYYDNGRPEVAVRMEGNRIGEVRGNSPSQSINTKQQQVAEDFLRVKKFAGHEAYIQEFAKKNTLLTLVKDPASIKPAQMMHFDLSQIKDSDVENNLEFHHLDGHENGIRADPTPKVVNFFKEKLIAAGEKAMDAGYYPTRVNVGGSYRGGVVTTRFNGVERDLDPATVVAANRLVIPSYANAVSVGKFLELSFVNGLSVGVDASFPKLNSIGVLKVEGDVALNLPTGARVSLVKQDSQKPTNLTVQGAGVIEQIVAPEYAGREFNVKAPDARYIPKEAVYEESYTYALMRVTNDNAVVVKYGDEERAIAKLAERMPNAVRTDFETSVSTQPAIYILANALSNNVKSLKDFAAVNKTINAFWKPTDTYDILPEKFGTIDAPNRIAENPPFGDLTEAPEVPSYARVAKYASNDALSELADLVVARPKGLREKLGSNIALEFEMQAADMRAGVIKALNNAVEDPNTMGSTREFRQAIFSITAADQHGAITQMALSNGPPTMFKDSKGYYEVRSTMKNDAGAVFEAVQGIPDSYGNTEAKMGLASVYMIAQRAMNKGLKKLDLGALGVTDAQLASAMASVNADPALKDALESARTKYNAYNRGMIEWLSSPQVAAITQADAKAYLKDEDYVPYYRVRPDGVAELVFGGEKTITIGDIRHQPYLAELKGGNDKIMPLDKSIMRNTMLLVTKGMNNMAMKNVGYAMQAAGQGLGPVDKSGKPTNLMPVLMGKGPADASVIRWTQEPDPNRSDDTGDRHLRVQTNDTMFGGVPAELIIKSLEGAHLTLPAFLKWGGIAGDLLRAGVTRTPIYLARQLFRDPFAATATSGLDYAPVTAIFKANREFLKIAAGKSETGAKMIEKGLMQSGLFEGDPANMSKMALQLASGKSQGVFDKMFAKADKLALQADAATRALIYENAIKNGLSEVEASHSVRESMNFTKRGLSPTVQYASRMIPFFNAQIQGLSVLFKAATGNMPANDVLKIKRKFFNNAMLLTGFGIAYAMAMDDDDYYKNAKPRDRYTNFFVPLPGVDEPLKLPIPYEFGFFFSAGVALADAIKGEVDTPQQLRALKDMFVGAIPGASSNLMPQIIKPIAEVYANKSFFSGNALVSSRLEKLDPVAQYNTNTTELAKFMAKMVPGLSPIQIEHIVSGYLGQIPLMVVATTNDLFRDGKDEPTRKLSEMPLIGSSFQRKYGGEEADVVYKLANEAMEAKRTFDNYRKTGKIEDAKDYLREHRAEIAVAPMALQYQKLMGALRTQEDLIRNSNASPDAKEKRIDALNAQRQLQSERYLKAIRRAEEASGRTTPP